MLGFTESPTLLCSPPMEGLNGDLGFSMTTVFCSIGSGAGFGWAGGRVRGDGGGACGLTFSEGGVVCAGSLDNSGAGANARAHARPGDGACACGGSGAGAGTVIDSVITVVVLVVMVGMVEMTLVVGEVGTEEEKAEVLGDFGTGDVGTEDNVVAGKALVVTTFWTGDVGTDEVP